MLIILQSVIVGLKFQRPTNQNRKCTNRWLHVHMNKRKYRGRHMAISHLKKEYFVNVPCCYCAQKLHGFLQKLVEQKLD